MATLADVRRIASALPGAVGGGKGPFGYGVMVKVRGQLKDKGFCWSWKERLDPKKTRVENLKVLAVRVSGEDEKQALLSRDDGIYFTEPHYNGYPAVLVRLAAIRVPELRALLEHAWTCLGGVRTRPLSPRRRGAKKSG